MAVDDDINPDIQDLITRIKTLSKDVAQADNQYAPPLTSTQKQKLLAATKSLTEKLESPDTVIWKVIFGAQAHASLRSAFRMRLFEVFQANGGSMSADELSAKIGAEKLLTVRIMRALCSVGIFNEIGHETYAHNIYSQKFTDATFRTMMIGMAGTFSPYMSSLPDYLSSLSFTNPSNPSNTLFHHATGTSLSFFDWLHTQPAQLDIFSAAMAASSAHQEGPLIARISGLFPPDRKKVVGEGEDGVLIVDVGGGRGQILDALRKARPNLKGEMIVQDLPREVEGRVESQGVKSMAYDFFTPQPIQGAHTYFFRHIFHDWPDASCRQILLQTIPAMSPSPSPSPSPSSFPSHSRIIIMDAVLPSQGASAYSSLLDINMIALAGIERTDRHWRELLEGVGLRVVRVEAGGMGDGIIEAVLSQEGGGEE